MLANPPTCGAKQLERAADAVERHRAPRPRPATLHDRRRAATRRRVRARACASRRESTAAGRARGRASTIDGHAAPTTTENLTRVTAERCRPAWPAASKGVPSLPGRRTPTPAACPDELAASARSTSTAGTRRPRPSRCAGAVYLTGPTDGGLGRRWRSRSPRQGRPGRPRHGRHPRRHPAAPDGGLTGQDAPAAGGSSAACRSRSAASRSRSTARASS